MCALCPNGKPPHAWRHSPVRTNGPLLTPSERNSNADASPRLVGDLSVWLIIVIELLIFRLLYPCLFAFSGDVCAGRRGWNRTRAADLRPGAAGRRPHTQRQEDRGRESRRC